VAVIRAAIKDRITLGETSVAASGLREAFGALFAVCKQKSAGVPVITTTLWL
jgi:hypothetical protein